MLDLEWPYKRHAGIFAGTQWYAQEQGWESTIDEFVDDTLPARRAKPVPYDGAIARATKELAQRCIQLDLPVVNVWFSSPAWRMLPGVFPDFAAAGRLQAEHLLDRGLRTFAALVCRRDRGHQVESREFRRVVSEAGFSCTIATIPLAQAKTLANWRKTERETAGWMDDWQLPIGVYVGADHAGRLVAQMCRQRGWRVPEDVAIITGWNEETICEHPRPSLTSVELGHERVGYEAARLLDRLMDEKQKGKKGAPPEHILLPPPGLVVRESTDFFAVDDERVAAALAFIAAHSHQPIGVNDVARAVTTHTRTLQRCFRSVLQRPIAGEIRRVRIERAKRELIQTRRPMSEIAHAVGFGETKRMDAVFRRELGVTPSEYRRQRQLEIGT